MSSSEDDKLFNSCFVPASNMSVLSMIEINIILFNMKNPLVWFCVTTLVKGLAKLFLTDLCCQTDEHHGVFNIVVILLVRPLLCFCLDLLLGNAMC